ncbi:SseB family protein [Methanobrevibacter sp.]|uniref:SseB family protein n=1 Tax=Methanobrevibacter sp. TaxID=66852 RepID=UPI00388D9475
MDKNELEENARIDNSALEELMKQDLTPQMQKEFFDVLKESQLYMPVSFSPNMFEGVENAKVGDVFQPEGRVGFDINYLADQEGNKAVPLFTSSEVMESAGFRSSAVAIFMSDLADMLKQTDKYSVIAVNPFTEFNLDIPIGAFLNLFEEVPDIFETLNGILKILKEKSVELEEDYAFFLRSDDDFMKEDAVDGVFIPNIPFNVSIRKEFHEEMKYLNILLMPKTKRIVYIGGVVDEDHYDTIIAPGSEFEWVEDLDEFTRVWKCGAQPFYDD